MSDMRYSLHFPKKGLSEECIFEILNDIERLKELTEPAPTSDTVAREFHVITEKDGKPSEYKIVNVEIDKKGNKKSRMALIGINSLRRFWKSSRYLDRKVKDYLYECIDIDTLPKNLETHYSLVGIKNSESIRVPLLKSWRKKDLPNELYNLKQIEGFIKNNFADNWKLIKQRHGRTGDIFTFEFTPTSEYLNSQEYFKTHPKKYTHLKVRSSTSYLKWI